MLNFKPLKEKKKKPNNVETDAVFLMFVCRVKFLSPFLSLTILTPLKRRAHVIAFWPEPRSTAHVIGWKTMRQTQELRAPAEGPTFNLIESVTLLPAAGGVNPAFGKSFAL